ncbi:ankyrin repeat domain-containing protein [Streptomyces sp. NPDC048483]|uniref:ankyrin repeat domain-containing protein n=1 Tax=Streptomyces sp. NPDC048483 TaxID=3154927 RepID=UPI003422D12C
MNFFDVPIAGAAPPEPLGEGLVLSRYEPAEDEGFAPADWFVPAQIRQVVEIGVGPDVRIMLTGWEVWPSSVTLRVNVFLRRARPEGRPDDDGTHPGGLRLGVQLSDGRKVSTLDGEEWPATDRPSLRLTDGSGGAFHYQLELHLSQLPPLGPTQLVVAWPDERVPETHTDIDAAALRAAVGEALEIWPDAAPPAPPSDAEDEQNFLFASIGPYEIMAQPPEPEEWSPPTPDPSRADWEWMGTHDWRDAELVRTRLANGADPDRVQPDSVETPLHLAAAQSPPGIVAELIARAREVDARDGEGCTALWHAVCHGAKENAALLLEAGADAWSPQLCGRSPGRLALTTAMAPLFAGLPGAVPLTEEERAAQREADERTAVFAGVETEGVSIAFVPGIDEDEAIRRLGGGPCTCTASDEDDDEDDEDDEDEAEDEEEEEDEDEDDIDPDEFLYGLDPWEFEDPERHIGVTGVPGGCVLIQPTSYLLNTDSVLEALSPGTTAYGLYFNPAGGTFGGLSRDGHSKSWEEIGHPALGSDSPDAHWLYRFWDWDVPEDAWGAAEIAYASAMAGLRVTDAAPLDGPPRRWMEIPKGSPLLD